MQALHKVPEIGTDYTLEKSKALYEQALRYLPAGASSNMRIHPAEEFPILFRKGFGPTVWDVDGNAYIDYLLAYGALILGHAHPSILSAIIEQLRDGTMLGTTTQLEVEVAKMIVEAVPCADLISFTNTGTEATMEAIRLARAITGKSKILKFEGHYHGHHDYVLFSVDAPQPVCGLEANPNRLPYCPGIPDEVSETIMVAPWNDPTSLERILKKHHNEIAAIITEPVMGNAGVIPPNPEYLAQLRELTLRYDVLLIFDEVLTGFRVAKGGAQELYGVTPDLACFAKALGGGAPIAAVAGKEDLMGMIGPGKVGFGGTYNGNPLSLAAAKATLQVLFSNNGEIFRKLSKLSSKLSGGLTEILSKSNHPGVVNSVGPLLSIYFTKLQNVSSYREAAQSDASLYKKFRDEMLKRGTYMHPDGLERLSLSAAHGTHEVEQTLRAAEDSLRFLHA